MDYVLANLQINKHFTLYVMCNQSNGIHTIPLVLELLTHLVFFIQYIFVVSLFKNINKQQQSADRPNLLFASFAFGTTFLKTGQAVNVGYLKNKWSSNHPLMEWWTSQPLPSLNLCINVLLFLCHNVHVERLFAPCTSIFRPDPQKNPTNKYKLLLTKKGDFTKIVVALNVFEDQFTTFT